MCIPIWKELVYIHRYIFHGVPIELPLDHQVSLEWNPNMFQNMRQEKISNTIVCVNAIYAEIKCNKMFNHMFIAMIAISTRQEEWFNRSTWTKWSLLCTYPPRKWENDNQNLRWAPWFSISYATLSLAKALVWNGQNIAALCERVFNIRYCQDNHSNVCVLYFNLYVIVR